MRRRPDCLCRAGWSFRFPYRRRVSGYRGRPLRPHHRHLRRHRRLPRTGSTSSPPAGSPCSPPRTAASTRCSPTPAATGPTAWSPGARSPTPTSWPGAGSLHYWPSHRTRVPTTVDGIGPELDDTDYQLAELVTAWTDTGRPAISDRTSPWNPSTGQPAFHAPVKWSRQQVADQRSLAAEPHVFQPAPPRALAAPGGFPGSQCIRVTRMCRVDEGAVVQERAQRLNEFAHSAVRHTADRPRVMAVGVDQVDAPSRGCCRPAVRA